MDQEKKSTSVSYGVGMACSFYEGYLTHVIPGDGGINLGLATNITRYEAAHNIKFPVKRLFLIITKSLHCPPELTEFNKENAEDLGIPYLETCRPLQDVTKSVAGVKDRVYRNSVYKVCNVRGAARSHVVAECATPLHTMHRVMEKRALFKELEHVDFDEVREDFCGMLKKIIERVPACRNKCELLFYDDTDPEQNLAEILLRKVQELAPNFKNLTIQDN